MFSNFTPYRYAGQPVVASLGLPAFAPCKPSDEMSIGFVPSEKHLIVRIERKVVPTQALKRRVDELAAEIEHNTGRKPGKKARAELKEQAHHELLPRAFPKRKDVQVTFLEDRGIVLIGSTTAADTDSVVSLLITVQPELQVSLLLTAQSPAAVMSTWLLDLDTIARSFGVGRGCVLSSDLGRVRYDKHTLDCENVREHLIQGKVVESLELEYAERVSFTLTDGLQFKGVALGDVVFEGQNREADADEKADAELFLWRAELGGLLDAVVEAFGGSAQ